MRRGPSSYYYIYCSSYLLQLYFYNLSLLQWHLGWCTCSWPILKNHHSNAAGAGVGSFLAILWGVAAEILHKPRVLPHGLLDPSVWVEGFIHVYTTNCFVRLGHFVNQAMNIYEPHKSHEMTSNTKKKNWPHGWIQQCHNMEVSPNNLRFILSKVKQEEVLQTRLVARDEVRRNMDEWRPVFQEEINNLISLQGHFDPSIKSSLKSSWRAMWKWIFFATQRKWEIAAVDVKAAFLQAPRRTSTRLTIGEPPNVIKSMGLAEPGTRWPSGHIFTQHHAQLTNLPKRGTCKTDWRNRHPCRKNMAKALNACWSPEGTKRLVGLWVGCMEWLPCMALWRAPVIGVPTEMDNFQSCAGSWKGMNTAWRRPRRGMFGRSLTWMVKPIVADPCSGWHDLENPRGWGWLVALWPFWCSCCPSRSRFMSQQPGIGCWIPCVPGLRSWSIMIRGSLCWVCCKISSFIMFLFSILRGKPLHHAEFLFVAISRGMVATVRERKTIK